MLLASVLLALTAPGQVAIDPASLPLIDGWPGPVALRLVDDGYPVVALPDDAEVVVRLSPHPGGLLLEAESYLLRRSEVIPTSDGEVLRSRCSSA